MESTQLNTFEELIEFLKANDLTPKEVNEIIQLQFKAFYIQELTKDEMIEGLVDWWAKWKHAKERPPFIGYKDSLNIDVIE